MAIRYYLHAISCYMVFGWLHELSHVFTAYVLGFSISFNSVDWFGLLLFRRFSLDLDRAYLIEKDRNSDDDMSWYYAYDHEYFDNTVHKRAYFLIRHVGWIASVFIALAAYYICRGGGIGFRNNTNERHGFLFWCQIAAIVTALDAISSDLLLIDPLYSSAVVANSSPNSVTFFCGNFGIILLHSAWWLEDDGCTSAFNILKKMIEVTMMRGAQAGGIITFTNTAKKEKLKNNSVADSNQHKLKQMKSIRSRVVKSKRQDLSKILINKLRRDFLPFNSSGCCKNNVGQEARLFAGHTRFATSSRANFDGTHPHQWTPPKPYRFYKLDQKGSYIKNAGLIPDSPQSIVVENFISHNGDFEFYTLNDRRYELETIQKYLTITTESEPPSVVDSCAIAGMIDLLRCQGCFTLCCRYVICLGLSTSRITTVRELLPTSDHYEHFGQLFEEALFEFQNDNSIELHAVGEENSSRHMLALQVEKKLAQYKNRTLMKAVGHFITGEEMGVTAYHFARAVIDAFFDNDLLNAVKIFMENAIGSFGLCVMSSLDAHSKMCLAARGQTISLALYPKKQIICYGSEQAAIKAGMLHQFPGSVTREEESDTHLDIDDDVQRLDLDDVGGEVCLIDWSGNPSISAPNRHITPHRVMHDKVALYLIQESSSISQPRCFHHRMTKLSGNPLINPLKEDIADPILLDINEIPGICKKIQDNWRNDDNDIMFSLNRLTAVNLGRCLKEKLEGYKSGAIHRSHKVDILVSGCEVSLWLAEQFASDLQKVFPNLRVLALSSNKLLGIFGQEDISVPSLGFPCSEQTLQFDDTIMLIVSHSGGTFAPLACSSLFQSMTNNIFVITSEWDSQIGQQLRSMNRHSYGEDLLFNSRIFTTNAGIRPAEPCSISVVATHQLLTNIFQYISIVIISNQRYRQISGAIITESDLQNLERCNIENIYALEEIVGTDYGGVKFESKVEQELRSSGNIWAEHVLENAKAHVITFVYVFGTVISGYPLFLSIARFAGIPTDSKLTYLFGFLDAIVYFFLPQINVIFLRLLQKRPLRHRMVGRTVVIADVPWVAQAAEAFLSKIFACSYSIAGLNVHSANPSDHLVHRMTHRVVRGTLLICGRPDGRLSALTATENAVCLSVNQASSIQSLGSTCETVTIGHNMFKLPLSARGIFLNRNRPLFLCEYLLAERDKDGLKAKEFTPIGVESRHGQSRHGTTLEEYSPYVRRPSSSGDGMKETMLGSFQNPSRMKSKSTRSSKSMSTASMSVSSRENSERGPTALLGYYKNIEKEMSVAGDKSENLSIKTVMNMAIDKGKWLTKARRLFEYLDTRNNGKLDENEFVLGLGSLNCDKTVEELSNLFLRYNKTGKGLSFDDFFHLMSRDRIEVENILEPCIRDSRGLIQVGASRERFFGETLIEKSASAFDPDAGANISISIGSMQSQNLCQELYESRIASMQRFLAMIVMFHQIGSRTQEFFPKISFGLLGYRMDRSCSILRVATTASPVSGAEIRERAKIIFYMKKIRVSIDIISSAWLDYKKRKDAKTLFW